MIHRRIKLRGYPIGVGKSQIAAMFAVGAVGVLAPAAAGAHFVLEAPPNWAEQDIQGQPQKTAPCGQADPQTMAVPTNAVTAFEPGQMVTVTINEATFHPGHYRVVLSTTGRSGLPADPPTTEPGTCQALAIQDPPVYPVLADGMLQHTDPLDGPQSFQVKLPDDVTCANCTLQVLEFMSAEVGGGGNCFYHHCADISIAAVGPDAGCGCAVGDSRSSIGAMIVFMIIGGLQFRRRRRAGLMVGAVGLIAAATIGCGDDRPSPVGFDVSPGDVERVWLDRVGTGPAQTAAVCGRGAADPVARALCQSPAPALGGLAISTGRWACRPAATASRRWRRIRWVCRRAPSPR